MLADRAFSEGGEGGVAGVVVEDFENLLNGGERGNVVVLGGFGEAVVFVGAFDGVEGDDGAVAAAELVVAWGDEGGVVVVVGAGGGEGGHVVVEHEVVEQGLLSTFEHEMEIRHYFALGYALPQHEEHHTYDVPYLLRHHLRASLNLHFSSFILCIDA